MKLHETVSLFARNLKNFYVLFYNVCEMKLYLFLHFKMEIRCVFTVPVHNLFYSVVRFSSYVKSTLINGVFYVNMFLYFEASPSSHCLINFEIYSLCFTL